MTNRGKALATAGCLLAVAVAALLGQEREPQYGGRSLSQWLDQEPMMSYPEDARLVTPAAEDAIRHIGVRAIPFALRWVSYEPSALRQWLIDHRRWIPARVHSIFIAENYLLPLRAESVFSVLGPAARPAIPRLRQLAMSARSGARTVICARALRAIGPEAVPALLAILENPHVKNRGLVAMQLLDFRTESALVVPTLVKLLQDPDQGVMAMAAEILISWKTSDPTVVPALVTILHSTNTWQRRFAASVLSELGPQATNAIPALVATLNDPDKKVRSQAEHALGVIQGSAITNTPLE